MKFVKALKQSVCAMGITTALLVPTASAATATTDPAPAPVTSKTLEAIDTSAVMWKYNVKNGTLDGRTEVPQEPYFGTAFTRSTAQLIETDWDGNGTLDLVTRLNSGHLILQSGHADNAGNKYRYSFRGIIGYGGWQTYDINAVKLRKTDKYPGLVARDNASGNLYYYPNTTGGDLTAPRIQIGFGGWTPMSEISAMDWDADGNMDLIVRNPQGELKLYRTDGNGTILNEARKTVDFGWNVMDHMAIEHDFAGAGTVGIIARDGNGYLYYYPISNGKVQPRTTIGYGGWSGYKIAAGSPATTASTAPVATVDNSPAGAKAYAKSYLASMGWGDKEYECLLDVWEHESNWNYTATNPTSGAYGIPQAYPASQMDSAGADWRTNSQTQIKWGVSYIKERYQTPCGAYDFWHLNGWY